MLFLRDGALHCFSFKAELSCSDDGQLSTHLAIMKRARQSSDQRAKAIEALRAGVHALSVSNSISTKDLVCRDEHAKTMIDFFEEPMNHSMQIFGMPGTGKTATVSYALAQLGSKEGGRPTAVFLNGFVVQKSADIYYTLYRHLFQARLGRVEECPLNQCAMNIEKRFRHGWGGRTPSLCVIVVDEVDKILERHAKGLFKVIDWLSLPFAACKLVTISNSMELQLDAKTRSRLDATKQLVFLPYNVQELKEILFHRVGSIQPKLFADQAVNLLCHQTASHSGDVRRLLQSASAAICSVLLRITEGLAEVTFTNGIVTVKDIHGVVRQIFHDRFVEFIKTLRVPVLFIAVAVLAKETEEMYKNKAIECRITMERLFLMTQKAQRICMNSDHCVSRAAFVEHMELLRQVSLIDISIGEDRIPVHSVVAMFDSKDTIYVSLLQPFQTVVDSCRLHDVFGSSFGTQLL